MRIWVDPAKLVGFNLSMAEVNQAISAQNVLISGGSVGSPPNPDSQRITATVTANGQLSTIEGFGKIVLRANTDGSRCCCATWRASRSAPTTTSSAPA